jgi:uroporphyrin-III C-methyltransferase/precorrin-2 dehydrogenase/sirohydrochlorin ferrochelatase
MDYLPIFLKVRDLPCLLVGGGEVGERKLNLLLQAGAQVTVLAMEINPSIRAHADAGRIALRIKPFESADVSGFGLVIAATNQHLVNLAVAEAARTFKVPVNVVDCPDLCDFIFPAIVDRSPLLVAISSGGASPVLTRLLRSQIEGWIPLRLGLLAQLAARLRERVKQALPNGYRRRHFWERILQGAVKDLILAGRISEAEALLESEILRESEISSGVGSVALVGAGPGDPDLLTLRALRLLQEADVVVYDRLVSPEVLALVRRDAKRIYAGKERNQHTLPQERINELLIRLALQGQRVIRLKGGDPFIFGRGGEEIETLMEHGIPFQVVPGVTAASGCAAYAGIPLTHRDYAHSCVFVAGHLKDGTVQGLDWQRLVSPDQTVVVYMGLQGVAQICAELIRHGAAPTTPAALIQQGTTANQRVLVADLLTLPEKVATSEVKAPTLIIIGKVVELREKLAWYHGQAEPSEPTKDRLGIP